ILLILSRKSLSILYQTGFTGFVGFFVFFFSGLKKESTNPHSGKNQKDDSFCLSSGKVKKS
ncbi:hypothetical protein OAC89_07340, partial [Deltaproteobacteria bacterium]|nr:hypothetical protein [Deltaproteobacteria bacterium]